MVLMFGIVTPSGAFLVVRIAAVEVIANLRFFFRLMQRRMQFFASCLSQYFLKFTLSGFFDALHALELLQQELFAGWSDAGNGIEFRGRLTFGTLVADGN